ncbi:DUF6089 family protein [Pararhodonellum marinum]|uniref:DUF6089 family protein n=1 Tax=Pararhodonellum marinum TaxID=2755358 RepID=UPI00188E24D9|nr:DUF6089 family protein [Pararhodonellum marinum]
MKSLYPIALLLYLLPSIACFGQDLYREALPRKHTVSFYLGSGFMYADNGGSPRTFDLRFQPMMAFSYGKQLTPMVKLTATLGFQGVRSNEGVFSESIYRQWAEEGQAYKFTGNATMFDIVPVAYLYPFENHMFRKRINLYGGFGLGVMSVSRTQYVFNETGDISQNASNTAPYIPVRIGLVVPFNGIFDLGIQGSLMYTFSDELDGNVGYNNRNDHLAQIQLTATHYISTTPFWKKWFIRL